MWLPRLVAKLRGPDPEAGFLLVSSKHQGEQQAIRVPLQLGVTCIGSTAATGAHQHSSRASTLSSRQKQELLEQWKADLSLKDVHGVFLADLPEPLHVRLCIEQSSASRWVLHIQDMCGQTCILPPGLDSEAVPLRQYDRVRIDPGTWLQLHNLEVCVCCPASLDQELPHEPHARMIAMGTGGRLGNTTEAHPEEEAETTVPVHNRRPASQQGAPADLHVRVSGTGIPASTTHHRQSQEREDHHSRAASGAPDSQQSSSLTRQGQAGGTASQLLPRNLAVSQPIGGADNVWVTNISLRPSTDAKRRSLEVTAQQKRRSLEVAAQAQRRSLDVVPPQRQRRSAEVQQELTSTQANIHQQAVRGSWAATSQLYANKDASAYIAAPSLSSIASAAAAADGIEPSPAVVDALLSFDGDVPKDGTSDLKPAEDKWVGDSAGSRPAPWVSHATVATARYASPPGQGEAATTWATPQKRTSFGQMPSIAGDMRPRSHSGSPAAQAAAARASLESSSSAKQQATNRKWGQQSGY